MAGRAKPKKRDRGRPTNASRATNAPDPSPQRGADQNADADEAVTAESSTQNTRGATRRSRRGRIQAQEGVEASGGETQQARPRRRGRPSDDTREEPLGASGEPPEAEHAAGKRKRGRPSRAAGKKPSGELDELEGPAPKRRRGRPSLDDGDPVEEAPDKAPEASPTVRKKRGRPPVSRKQGDDAPVEAEQPRKRGRPRKSDPPDAAADTVEPRPRGRPRKSGTEEAEPRGEPEPRRRGRPRRSDVSDTGPSRPRSSDAAAAEPRPPGRRGRPRRSGASDATPPEPTAAEEPNDGTTTPDASSPEGPPAKRPYRYMAARQREIPVSTISSKWTPLPPPSLNLARQILRLSERPVLQSLAPGPRRDAASAAIRGASRRLVSKLTKGLPFPPASRAAARASRRSGVARADGREAELDFEAVASDMEALERRLDPLTHSIEALRAEEARMEGVLRREAAALEELSRNARGELGLWRAGLRKRAHPLVPERWDPDGDGGDALVLAPREEGVSPEWLFADTEDTSPPLSTLTSHIASLQNNIRPLQDLDRAMADSEAAIRRVLSHALEPERFEAAIMAERT